MDGPLFDGDLPLLLSMRRSGRPPPEELEATLAAAAADMGLREARSTSELGLLTFNSNLKLLREEKELSIWSCRHLRMWLSLISRASWTRGVHKHNCMQMEEYHLKYLESLLRKGRSD